MLLVALIASALTSSFALAADPSLPNTTVPSEPPAMSAPVSASDAQSPTSGAVKVPKVSILEPKDGATVSQKFKIKFGVEGMKIANAGTMTPGTGHHHLIVDGGAVAKGQVVPSDAQHVHFGRGQTETELSLKPGPHTLTLQFADGAHLSYGEMMSQTIHITVK
jgi:hypothetical protein